MRVGIYGSGISESSIKYLKKILDEFGIDFSMINVLEKNKIKITDGQSKKNTTRFNIVLNDSDRKLFVHNRCEPLQYVDEQSDGLIISPVYDEISDELFKKIKQESSLIFLDPQGFLRNHDSNNEIYLKEKKMDLDGISGIKVNSDELIALTGASDDNALRLLQKQGIENIVLTNKQNISLLVKDKIYSIKFIPKNSSTMGI